MLTDAEMLRRYVRERDEHAFAHLVQRHIGVVYGAALRRTGGRAHLAEEIAQKVFTDLARKAATLCHHPALAGWLHRSTRYTAIDVARAEQRGQKLAHTFATMPDTNLTPDTPVDWEQVRPVLDEALDQLKESDREAMLLRYFEGLGFAEVGARLNVSENAARMRTERALEKLRSHLGKRGVTSTAAALGLVLANQAFAAAPAGLAAAVTATALSAAPATGGLLSLLLMSKLTAPVLSAVVAAGITALVWTSVVPSISAVEHAALRAENARLVQATAADASAQSLAAVANDFATQATAIANAMTERQASQAGNTTSITAPASGGDASAATPRGHRFHGNATARDAALTFAWASDLCDYVELAKLVYFDEDARVKAEAVLATMPDALRAQYPTPEALYGMLLAASCLAAPPPGADMIELFMHAVELRPDRVAMRRKGSDVNFHEYQLTETGWKYVLPAAGVDGLPRNLNSETLARLARR